MTGPAAAGREASGDRETETGGPEVRTRHGWRRLRPGATAPAVAETEPVELRGLPPGAGVRLGPAGLAAGADGRARLRPVDDEQLRGHVGLLPVTVAGRPVGEVEIVPDKLSEAAYQALRADLQRVWGDLVHDPDAPTASLDDLDPVAAAGALFGTPPPPPARELWRRIDHAVVQILESPHEHLRVGTGVRRMERVQHRRELQPAVVRAGRRGRAALTRTLERSTDTPENHLVGSTLRLLHRHARAEPGAEDVVRRVERLLREPLLAATPARPLRRVTWGMRRDPRYRQVLSVHQVLHRPELEAAGAAGELRRGVAALPRLYEWWVFLQVLVAAAARYGPPHPPGIEALAVRVPGRRPRLVLPAGATVTFPGPVHVAFEPQVTTRGDGWMGLEYVPHPDPARYQSLATPDVVVFRAGPRPWLTVIDAKYVGRGWVPGAAARAHEKYARMRWGPAGEPVVRHVVVAHPHEGLSFQWAGYGAVTLRPGEPGDRDRLPLPLPVAPPPA